MGLMDWIVGSKAVERSPEAQARVDADCARLTLYQYPTCPFCLRVRRAVKRLALDLDSRDILGSDRHLQELSAGGGKTQVPCLRIQHEDGSSEWLYESADIIDYLERRFGE